MRDNQLASANACAPHSHTPPHTLPEERAEPWQPDRDPTTMHVCGSDEDWSAKHTN